MNTSPRPLQIFGLNYAPEQTGNAPYTTSLAERLVADGTPVSVTTAHPHYPAWRVSEGYGGWKTVDEVNGVHLTRLAHYVPKNPKGIMRLLSEVTFGVRTFFSHLDKKAPALLVSPALFSSWIMGLRLRLSGVPYGIWIQDIYSLGVQETGGSGIVAKIMTKVESAALRRAGGVVVIHDRFKAYVVDHLGVDPEKVTVIRNWTHLPEQPAIDRDAFRAQYDWAPDQTVVLHAGNQGVKQALENVVEAAQLAQAQNAPVLFVLLGGGSEHEKLRALAGDCTHIRFLASLPTEDFQRAMASADILLVNEDGGIAEMAVPSKLTSYFTTGLPVLVATDERSITAQEVRTAEAGLRVDPSAPQALVDGALTLAADPELRTRLGEAGRRFREENLSTESAIAAYRAFFDSLTRP